MKNYENKDGYILIPEDDYREMRKEIMELRSAAAYYRSYAEPPYDEELPGDMIYAMTVEGMNPIRAYRIHRGLSQSQLAQRAGVSKTLISHIENDKKQGSVHTFKDIADVLKADLNKLI